MSALSNTALGKAVASVGSSLADILLSTGSSLRRQGLELAGPAAATTARPEFFHRAPGTSFAAPTVRAAESSAQYAECVLAEGASCWYNSRVAHGAMLGVRSNLQEGAELGRNSVLGKHVSVGPNARIGENVIIDDKCFVGASAVIGEGARLSPGTIVAPGTVVPAGAVLSGGFWAGNPAKLLRSLNTAEIEAVVTEAEELRKIAQAHIIGCATASTPEEVALLRQSVADHITTSEYLLKKFPGRWDLYTRIERNPIRHPERRGLLFDKN